MLPLTALLDVGGKLIDKLSLQSLFWCFTSSQPKINRVIRQTCFFTPFRNRQRFSKDGNKPSVSSIFGLFFSGSPNAIFWAIPFLVVNSLNAKPVWSFTHVIQKIGVVKPMFTNCDPSTAVVFVRFTFRTCASFFNALPYLISRGSLPTQSVPMRKAWVF